MRRHRAHVLRALALLAAFTLRLPAQSQRCGADRWNVKVLSDQDAAGDPADRTKFLVAEIPDSACALGSRYTSDFAEARRVFDNLPVGIEVEVEGVGFWDDDHGQLGASPNDIELHPVLKLTPVLNRSDLLRTELGADSVAPDEVRVWLNTSSRVYHCPGSANYGNTSRGQYMPGSAAIRAGGRPAGGRRCR